MGKKRKGHRKHKRPLSKHHTICDMREVVPKGSEQIDASLSRARAIAIAAALGAEPIEQWRDHYLLYCRDGFRQGWESALWEAVLFCEEQHIPLPDWAHASLAQNAKEELGLAPRTIRRGRTATWKKKMDQYMTDSKRYFEVLKLRGKNPTWSLEKTYFAVGDSLHISPESVKVSYKKIRKQQNAYPLFSLAGPSLAGPLFGAPLFWR